MSSLYMLITAIYASSDISCFNKKDVCPNKAGSLLLQFDITCLPLGYERVYLLLCKVADTTFHIQGGECISLECIL